MLGLDPAPVDDLIYLGKFGPAEIKRIRLKEKIGLGHRDLD